jgi:phosphate transport system substrate-binding protein
MEISGAGATFPYPLYAKWADAYKKETGTTVNYYPIGSGGGIKQIQSNVVTFGASDMPLKLDLLNKDGLVQFPTVIGGVVPVVNVEGVRSGELKLDGATLAKVFLGDIKSWNDPAIAKLNPDTKLPPLPIVVVRRLDGSERPFSGPITCPKSAGSGSPRSAATPLSSGRSASVPTAMTASPTACGIRRVPSAMSSTPMPSRASWRQSA